MSVARNGKKIAATVRILTLGCAKNEVDAEVMAGLLGEEGFSVVSSGRADVAIVNTCGFIRDAKEESIAEILSLGKARRSGRIRLLVVAGCLAARYRQDLPKLLPEVDLFVGPGEIPDIPRLVKALVSGGVAQGSPDAGRRPAAFALPDGAYRRRVAATPSPYAFLKILEGCDNRCTYCTIPSIRGPLASRGRASLLEEARMLVRRGAREINLVGQDITTYGNDRGEKGALAPLVSDLCRIRGIGWVRLLYLHPGRIGEDLVGLLAAEKKLCPYLDIPVQHIDPHVLSRMGRRYTPEEVRDLLRRLRERIPGIFLRTSVIVGFPGETAQAFDRLLRFVHEAQWDYLGVFPYSREEGTPAYAMGPPVREEVTRERARRIRDAQADILASRNAAMAGREIEVLVERTEGGGKAVGRHRGQAPEVDGQVLLSGCGDPPGTFLIARVTGAREWDLLATPVRRGGSAKFRETG
jgi:ribosomal protein S12 methylthiotransferase